ncbi:MAG: outer membrane beta-barrel protein [Muribaculaceae bacterium]|nr:outer membrane beta-barrel protein [Muribaculaceae bacterium]
MKRAVLLLLALQFTLLYVSARTIQGVVCSSVDSTAVEGADCRLLASGKMLAGTSSAENGSFRLECDNRGPVTLMVSMTGYNPTELVIESGGGNINAGNVYLDVNSLLGEVSVEAGSVITSKGRTIVFPSAADMKASATAIGLFQKLPLAGLIADPINRSLSVDGGTPVILINGVPSTIGDLNALQPKDIEKIEYSRFTPARYADKGNTGFLNVILRKRTDGGQVYIWARSAVNTAFVDADVKASYHQGPSQFTFSYDPSWRNYQNVYDHEQRDYIADDFDVHLVSSDRNPFYYHYHNMRLKYDYTPSSKTLFSATFRATPNISAHRLIGDISDTGLGDYSTWQKSKDNNFAPSLDLFLRHEFNDRNSLEAQVVGTLSSNDYSMERNYYFNDGTDLSYLIDVDSRRRSLISEISYIHDFNDNLQLSGGFQNSVSHSTNRYLSTDYEPVLTENNNYLYARLGYSVGKFYLSLSSGAKLFWIHNDDNHRNFVRNLSQFFASWNLSQRWSLQAGFSYSPGIPSLSALTDYPQQVSPYLISNGNPDLKVSNSFLYQLMPSFRYKKLNLSLLMNYSNITNFVMEDVTYLGDGLFLSQSVNARKYRRVWGNLNMRLTDIAGFGASVNLGLSHYEDGGDGWTHHLTSFNANFSIWWNKGPYTISYWRKIPGKSLYGHTVSKDENGDMLQFEYKPDKHWTLTAGWWYMFESKGTQYPQWNYSPVNPGTSTRCIRNNANMIVLSVSYSADFGSIFRTGRRSLNNSDSGSSILKY